MSTKKEVRLRGWQRSAIAAAAGLCLASIVYAQQTAGSISGRATAGATVLIESPTIGIKRQTTVDPDGTYQLPQVPPGTYKVSIIRGGAAAETREVIVTAGSGATVNFGDAQVVTVTGSAVRTIDVSTVNPSFTVTKAELERIPVQSNVTSVTLLAPGAVQGEGGFLSIGPQSRATNLASIGGASVAENAYYINGFNVTNINKGLAFNEVPFEAIAEVQVLNGGYGVEFGRSLGGVVSVNTKRGTNEFKGGGIVSWQPAEVGGLRLRGRSVHAEQSTLTGRWNLIEGPGETERLSANVYLGGPIIKDKLYGFALVEGQNIKENTFGQTDHTLVRATSPKYLAKLDWDINEKNRLELTLFSDKVKDREGNYEAVSPYTTQLGTDNGTSEYTTGGTNTIVKWTGLLTDDITLSALGGKGKYSRGTNIPSSSCPVVAERRTGFTAANLGCWTGNGIVDVPNASDERDAYRLDFSWALGAHTVRAGLDYEKYTTVDGSTYSGLAQYVVQRVADGAQVGGSGFINNTGGPLDVVRTRFLRNGGTFVTKNSAWYVEDSWQATKELVLTGGIRGESFENLNDSGGTFIKVTNTISPRAGFAWDLGGKAETKLYGNLGRYYIPVYSNTNVRLSGAETFYEDYFAFNGYSTDRTQAPILGAQLGTRQTFGDGSPKDPRTVVDPNIKPMFQDEFILGLEKALNNRWTFGVKYTNRRLKKGMDDICEGTLAENWALASGYSPTQAANIGDTISNCFLYNPGEDLTANIDLNGDGNLTPVRIPASALLMPKVKRKYDSLEFTLNRQWDKKWSAALSLVLAWSRGNTEGYVRSDNQQDDAGISTSFDHPGLMEGSDGPLPNDRRYTIKANGSYALTDEWRLGGTALIQSGRPKNCLGYYAGSIADDSLAYGAASFYCNGQLVPRGSLGRLDRTWDFGLQLQYTPLAVKGLTLKADVLNVLNRRTVWGITEEGEAGSAGSPSPNADRPRLAAIQPPRTFRFTAAYEF